MQNGDIFILSELWYSEFLSLLVKINFNFFFYFPKISFGVPLGCGGQTLLFVKLTLVFFNELGSNATSSTEMLQFNIMVKINNLMHCK